MSVVQFLPKAIEIAKQAIEEDGRESYDKALSLYALSIEYFLTAIKYEKNDIRKKTIFGKVEQYMVRAEQIKELVRASSEGDASGAAGSLKGGTAAKKRGEPGSGQDDNSQEIMRGALAQSIMQVTLSVHWDDVAGLDEAKESLKEAVVLPVRFPRLFTGNRKPWRAILLYGPPGTGKSHLARAVATESQRTFFSISSADLVSKWVGDSEKQVRTLFQMSREKKPSVIFIDEIDSVCGNRSEGSDTESSRRMKNEFMIQINGVGNDMDGILLLAATNLPWVLDPAIRRRFDKRIYIPLPSSEARAHMFKLHIGSTPHALSDQDFETLARLTENYSGSDICVIVREALMVPIRDFQKAKHFKRVAAPNPDDPTEYVECWSPCDGDDLNGVAMSWDSIRVNEHILEPILTLDHFLKSIERTRPTVCMDDIRQYTEWTAEFGQEGNK